MRRRLVVLLTGGAALLLLAAAGGVYVARSGDSAVETYCWGAWTAAQAPVRPDGAEVHEDPPPTADHPEARCLIERPGPAGNAAGGHGVTVTYGQLPEGDEDRRAWLVEHLTGTGSPLPEGLPGQADSRQGLLVLPPACDVAGRPSVVTVRTHGEPPPGVLPLGSPSAAAQLLTSVAERGMAEVGCAGEEPIATGQPVGHGWQEPQPGRHELCGLAGMPEGVLGDAGSGHRWSRAHGVPGAASQVCSAHLVPKGSPAHRSSAEGLLLTAAADERLVALLTAVAGPAVTPRPEEGWGGRIAVTEDLAMAEADCGTEAAPARTVFLVLRTTATERSPGELLPDFVRAAQAGAGCAEVAPT